MQLARRQRIADNIYAVTLACEQGAPLPDIAPGDHIEVRVPGGTRAYSLCKSPTVARVFRVCRMSRGHRWGRR